MADHSTPPPTLQHVADDLQTQLSQLLSDRTRHVALQSLSPVGPPQQAIATRITTIDTDVANLLMGWTGAGGHVRLTLPDAPLTRRHAQVATAEPEATPQTLQVGGTDWRKPFATLMLGLGPAATDEQEAERLETACSQADRWSGWPAHVQKHLIGMLATRMRVLQDAERIDMARFRNAFSSLTSFSKREKPGFVFGLSRNHQPHGDSWFDDAERHREHLLALLPAPGEQTPSQHKVLEDLRYLVRDAASAHGAQRAKRMEQAAHTAARALEVGFDSRDPRLVRVATPIVEHLVGPHFRRLRRAVREASDHASDGLGGAALSADWAWWSHTRERRALLVGDNPGGDAINDLQRTFELASLEWAANPEHAERAQHLATRIRDGQVDLLILQGRVLDDDADQLLLSAARASQVCWVHLSQAPSPTQLRYAIERFLEPCASPRTQGSQRTKIAV